MAGEPGATGTPAKVDIIASASESEIGATFEALYTAESGVQVPSDIATMRSTVYMAAASPLLLRQLGGGVPAASE